MAIWRLKIVSHSCKLDPKKAEKKADVHLTDLTDAQQHFLPLSGDLLYRSSAWRGIKMGMILVESIFLHLQSFPWNMFEIFLRKHMDLDLQ